jgi:hypothetical protein
MKLGIVMLIAGLVLVLSVLMPTDSTDKSRLKTSGMYLHTDYGTGCQYLSGGGFFGKGVLIPRVDKAGRHVCE